MTNALVDGSSINPHDIVLQLVTFSNSMIGENRQLVTNEPVEFEK